MSSAQLAAMLTALGAMATGLGTIIRACTERIVAAMDRGTAAALRAAEVGGRVEGKLDVLARAVIPIDHRPHTDKEPS